MIAIIPATIEHYRALYGDNPPFTMRAMTAVEGDRVLGMAGVYDENGNQVVFAKLTDELKGNRKAVLRGARKVMAMFDKRVFALCDPNLETADGFLRHFGFKPVGKGVYQWNI